MYTRTSQIHAYQTRNNSESVPISSEKALQLQQESENTSKVERILPKSSKNQEDEEIDATLARIGAQRLSRGVAEFDTDDGPEELGEGGEADEQAEDHDSDDDETDSATGDEGDDCSSDTGLDEGDVQMDSESPHSENDDPETDRSMGHSPYVFETDDIPPANFGASSSVNETIHRQLLRHEAELIRKHQRIIVAFEQEVSEYQARVLSEEAAKNTPEQEMVRLKLLLESELDSQKRQLEARLRYCPSQYIATFPFCWANISVLALFIQFVVAATRSHRP